MANKNLKNIDNIKILIWKLHYIINLHLKSLVTQKSFNAG